jgi:hypothetical protein
VFYFLLSLALPIDVGQHFIEGRVRTASSSENDMMTAPTKIGPATFMLFS